MEVPKFIKGVAKYFTYASGSGETTPTTQADLQELMKNNNTILECLVDGLWQPEKEMKLNQIIRSPNMPPNTVAKVTSTGTTGTTEPEWPETVEATVSDGSVTFTMTELLTKDYEIEIDAKLKSKADLVNGKVPAEQLKALGIMTIPDNSDLNDYKNAGVYCCNADVNAATISNVAAPKAFYLEVLQMMDGYVKQVFSSYPINNPSVYIRMYDEGTWGSWKELGGTPIGDVIYRPYLLTGHVKANGATVSRSDYPTLEAFANEKKLWGNNVWQYGVGDGSTTMVLPNYMKRVLEGGDTPAVLDAGLPNITGDITFSGNSGASGASGCFASAGSNKFWASGDGHNGININMNASRSSSIYGASNTVQPPAIVLIPQIKY